MRGPANIELTRVDMAVDYYISRRTNVSEISRFLRRAQFSSQQDTVNLWFGRDNFVPFLLILERISAKTSKKKWDHQFATVLRYISSRRFRILLLHRFH